MIRHPVDELEIQVSDDGNIYLAIQCDGLGKQWRLQIAAPEGPPTSVLKSRLAVLRFVRAKYGQDMAVEFARDRDLHPDSWRVLVHSDGSVNRDKVIEEVLCMGK